MNTAREQALIQTRRTREDAERLLTSLLEAQAGCDAQLAAENRPDLVRKVKGRTSLEEAIEQTRRMIDVLKRAEEEATGEAASAPGSAGSTTQATDTGPSGRSASVANGTPSLSTLISEFKSRGLDLPGLDDAETSVAQPEDEPSVVGVLRPAASSPRSNVFLGSRTSTRWGAGR
jgi:hypothetical protein